MYSDEESYSDEERSSSNDISDVESEEEYVSERQKFMDQLDIDSDASSDEGADDDDVDDPYGPSVIDIKTNYPTDLMSSLKEFQDSGMYFVKSIQNVQWQTSASLFSFHIKNHGQQKINDKIHKKLI